MYSASLSQGDRRAMTEQECWEGNLVETKYFTISLPLSSDIALPLQEEGLEFLSLTMTSSILPVFMSHSGEISLWLKKQQTLRTH